MQNVGNQINGLRAEREAALKEVSELKGYKGLCGALNNMLTRAEADKDEARAKLNTSIDEHVELITQHQILEAKLASSESDGEASWDKHCGRHHTGG